MLETRTRELVVQKTNVMIGNGLDSVIVYQLPQDEFDYMSHTCIFEEIMEHYDHSLILDDYEEGEVTSDLEWLMNLANDHKDECPVFALAAKSAYEYGFGISFCL